MKIKVSELKRRVARWPSVLIWGAVGEGEMPAMYADRIGIDGDKLSDECLEIKEELSEHKVF